MGNKSTISVYIWTFILALTLTVNPLWVSGNQPDSRTPESMQELRFEYPSTLSDYLVYAAQDEDQLSLFASVMTAPFSPDSFQSNETSDEFSQTFVYKESDFSESSFYKILPELYGLEGSVGQLSENNRWIPLNPDEDIPLGKPLDILEEHVGHVWVETEHKPGLYNKDVKIRVEAGPGGSVWIARHQMQHVYEPGYELTMEHWSVEKLTMKDGLEVSNESSLWVGTFRRELYNFETEPLGLKNNTPENYALLSNQPNPFNPTTTIPFKLPEATNVKINVYDITGHQVAQLTNRPYTAGAHKVTFNARGMSKGLYLVRANMGSKTFTRKITLLN